MGRKLNPNILYYLVFLGFVVLAVGPVIYTFFNMDGGLADNLKQLDEKVLVLLGKSSLIALIVSVLSTVVGVILAFFLYKTKMRFRSFFKVVMLIPLLVSPYVLAVAWKDLFFFLGVDSMAVTYVGMIGVLGMIYAPLSMLMVGSALTNIDGQIEEAGLMLTGFWPVFWKIVLPLIKPALVSSLVLVFIFSLSEFSVAAYFGVKVITTEIFTQFSAFYNYGLASLQSLLLVLICVALLFAERKYLAEAPFLSIGAKGQRHKEYPLPQWVGVGVVGGWVFVSVVLPFLMLFAQALRGGQSVFFKAVNLLRHSFPNTIILALTGAFLVTLVGLVAGLGYFRKGRDRKVKIDFWLLLIFAIPSTVYGISLIRFYNQDYWRVIYSSYGIILVGYVGKFSFIAAKIIGNSIRQIPQSLDESAEIMGIGYWTRLRKIVLPIIGSSIQVAFLIGFIFSLGELGTTIMVYPPGTEMMPIKVYTLMANAPEALTSAMVLVVFGVSLLSIGVLVWLGRWAKAGKSLKPKLKG